MIKLTKFEPDVTMSESEVRNQRTKPDDRVFE